MSADFHSTCLQLRRYPESRFRPMEFAGQLFPPKRTVGSGIGSRRRQQLLEEPGPKDVLRRGVGGDVIEAPLFDEKEVILPFEVITGEASSVLAPGHIAFVPRGTAHTIR